MRALRPQTRPGSGGGATRRPEPKIGQHLSDSLAQLHLSAGYSGRVTRSLVRRCRTSEYSPALLVVTLQLRHPAWSLPVQGVHLDLRVLYL